MQVGSLKCPVCLRLFTEIHHHRCGRCDEYRREEPASAAASAAGVGSAAGGSSEQVPAAAAAAAAAVVRRWDDSDGEYGVHYMELRRGHAADYDREEDDDGEDSFERLEARAAARERAKRDELEYKEEPVFEGVGLAFQSRS